MAENRVVGTVKWFDPDRGYGFIAQPGGKDVYVNLAAVEKAGLDTLDAGQRVSFALQKTPRGFQAVDLSLAEGAPLMMAKPDLEFGSDYLAGGYFLDANQEIMCPEILDKWAVEVAKALGNSGMTSHQLRRFFNKVRAIEGKLRSGEGFATVRKDILAFKRDVAYGVGRGVVPEGFKRFIDLNVELAVSNINNFDAFLEHFQSVLAYFVYFFRDR